MIVNKYINEILCISLWYMLLKKITKRGDRKCKEIAMGFVILNLLIPEGLIGKVIFENRSKRGGGSRCKDPEVEACYF